jgi:Co/Zn/Cd efflux system component
MSGCSGGGCSLDVSQKQQRHSLIIVFIVNAIMFVVVSIAAFYGNTTALLADSLDNLGDALTYGLSFYAVTKGARIKAKVALFKGYLILFTALIVVSQIIYKLIIPSMPIFEIMGLFSILGLIANSFCLYILSKHRDEDINMSSVWECSRNDMASNLAVLIAAFTVWATTSALPDIIIATALVILLLRSSISIITSAKQQLNTL